MPYRTESWDKEIAYQLQHDKKYARLFIELLIKNGESPVEVLRRVVRGYGVKELSDKTSLPPQSIIRVLRAPEKAREGTLNRMVKAFGVKMRKELAFA